MQGGRSDGGDIFAELMVELDGADPETVNRIAWERGSLPVRLAMLGLAAAKKGTSPLWWGYPPGVFIGYKWDGERMRELTAALARHVRGLGYRPFLDAENLDADADAYFQIPQFITSLQECTFYVLLLTELSADMLAARKNKTTWIYDEHDHATRMVNGGRLFIVPVLLEPGGLTDFYTRDRVLDLTADPHDFSKLEDMLAPGPVALTEAEADELKAVAARFDATFLGSRWDEADEVLREAGRFGHTFDHQFRRMLHSLYTADGGGFEAAHGRLLSVYGRNIMRHIYKGYCHQHRIPSRINYDG
jgi:hypothetical protein